MHVIAKDSVFWRAVASLLGVAAAIPLGAFLVSLVLFPLMFVLEPLLIGAYPFLATFKSGTPNSTHEFSFAFDWALTGLQWGAIAVAFALIARARSITDTGDHIILAIGVWVGINILVRVSLVMLDVTVLTTPVRM